MSRSTLAVAGRLTISVRKIVKALLILSRRPDGARQPPPAPPKKGGELTANTRKSGCFVLVLLLF